MTNLGIIYDKLKTYSEKDKFELFADCVRDKLDIHLTEYYKRLSSKLEKAYTQVLNADDAKLLKEANKHLNKANRPKF